MHKEWNKVLENPSVFALMTHCDARDIFHEAYTKRTYVTIANHVLRSINIALPRFPDPDRYVIGIRAGVLNQSSLLTHTVQSEYDVLCTGDTQSSLHSVVVSYEAFQLVILFAPAIMWRRH